MIHTIVNRCIRKSMYDLAIRRFYKHPPIQIRRFTIKDNDSPSKANSVSLHSFSMSGKGLITHHLSDVEKVDLDTSFLPVLAVTLFGLFFFNQDSESKKIKELAKNLGIPLPEEENPDALYLLREKCFEASYVLCKQGKWDLLKNNSLLLTTLTDSDGHTLLAYAILSKELTIAQKLIELDIGINKKDNEGNTPLHLAAEAGLFTLFTMLKDDINDLNSKGETPLHLAIKADKEKSIQSLLTSGASLKSVQGISPVGLAVAYGAKKSLPFLLDKENIYTKVRGGTLLHFSIKIHSTGMLMPLLEKEGLALIEEKDHKGRTPLGLAAYLGDEEALRILSQNGASLNFLGNETPLHLAIKGNHPHAFAYLFALSKEVNGDTYYSYARLEGKNLMAEFIEKNIIGKKWTPKDQPPENLVIKGGGPKGTAFIGALEELKTNGALANLKRLIGTSSGAIVSSLLAVGHDVDEIHDILKKNPVDTLLDPPEVLQENLKDFLKKLPEFEKEIKNISEEGVANNKMKVGKKLLRTYWNWWWLPGKEKQALKGQWKKGGLCSGDYAFNIINEKLSEKFEKITGKKFEYLTFGDLQDEIKIQKKEKKQEEIKLKELTIVATQIGHNPQNFTFSSLDPTCKDISIASAVRASMSIPLVFEPTPIYKVENGTLVNAGLGLFVDGGLLDNYPIDKLDIKQFKPGYTPDSYKNDPWVNPYTWGLNLYSSEEKKTKKNEAPNVKDILIDCIQIYTNAETILRKNKEKTESRTINIDNLDISLIDFTKNPDRDQKLIESGRAAVLSFLASAKLSRLGKSPLYYNFVDIKKKKETGSFNLPPPHSSFINREALLKEIESRFITQNICILSGLPGYGKSVLANAYAYKNAEKYSLIFWIDSGTESAQEISYLSLANTLKISTRNIDAEAPLSLENLKEEIYTTLENSKKTYLLILDNVTQPQTNLPKNGSILITTQKKIPGNSPVRIPSFNLDEACALFEETTGEKRSPAMEKLATNQLHLSPLLIRMAAHYITLNPNSDISSYAKNLENKKNKETLLLTNDPEYAKSLQATYRITEKRLREEEPLSIEVLDHMIHLSPDHIPIALIDAYLSLTFTSFSYQEYQREKILKALEQYSLIEWQKESNTFSIHRQTQEIFKLKKNSPTVMIKLINDYPPVAQYNPMTPGTLSPFQTMVPHCASLMNTPITDPEPRSRLALTLARYYIESEGNLNEAKYYLEQAKKAVPFEAITGRIHFYQGMICRGQAKYKEAIGEFQKAEEYFEKDLEEKHYTNIEQLPVKCKREYQVAIAKIYFAQSLKDENKTNLSQLSKANDLLEESKQIMMNLLGKDHFDIARILREQGEIQMLLGKYPEAQTLIIESLNSQKEIYKKDFYYKSSTAATFSLFGDLYQKMGSFGDAITAYEEALKTNKNIYHGENHHNVACIYKKLAEAYRRSKNIDLGNHMEQKAIEIEINLEKRKKL